MKTKPVFPFTGGPTLRIYLRRTVPAQLSLALEGVSDVLILADLVGDPITKKYPKSSQMINLDGILQVIRSLNGRGLNRVIFISTCSNYGLLVSFFCIK